MAFLHRLGWYLAGLSIGIVLLIFFLKKKAGENQTTFCYFPNCRVLKDMRSKPVAFEKNFLHRYRDTLLVRSFLTEGTIDFGKSDTQSNPCKTYYISHTLKEKKWIMKAVNCKDTLMVHTLTPSKQGW